MAQGRARRSGQRRVNVPGIAELLRPAAPRVTLRGYGLPADRGRLVREALAVLLANLDAEGAESLLARRLRDGQ